MAEVKPNDDERMSNDGWRSLLVAADNELYRYRMIVASHSSDSCSLCAVLTPFHSTLLNLNRDRVYCLSTDPEATVFHEELAWHPLADDNQEYSNLDRQQFFERYCAAHREKFGEEYRSNLLLQPERE